MSCGLLLEDIEPANIQTY